MCGIAGFFALEFSTEESVRLMRRMLSVLYHRGPDEHGYMVDRYGCLGTARLSIIDLKTGAQPIGTADGRYWIAFNGEIFNYIELGQQLEAEGCVFNTRSDTEVLLQALCRWGEEALHRVNGQFAFLFYDRRTGRVIAARDPYGERPLFFHRPDSGGVMLASEIKALFALSSVPRQLSPNSLRRLFHLWTPLPDESCFESIQSLPPGYMAVFERGSVTTRPYYRFPSGPKLNVSREEAAERVRAALDQSVVIRLRSDVEVGTYLSGGLDSSITTLLAQKHNSKPVRSFAISFEEESHDESVYQQSVRRHLGTEHHVVRISKAEIADSFPEVIWHTECAQFRTAPVPMFHLSKLVRDSGIKVVLTGEGADEAFLGYDIFKETLFRIECREAANKSQLEERVRGLYPYLPHFNAANASMLVRVFSQFLEEKTAGLFSHEVRFSNGQFAGRLIRGGEAATAPEQELSDVLTRWDPHFLSRSLLERTQILEYATLLAGYLLSSQGDRMTAAHSVEGRCPFLDPGVVKLAFSLPEHVRLTPEWGEKQVLKDAFGSMLPEEVVKRPKQPYRAPDAESFVGEHEVEWVQEILRPETIARCPILDTDFAGRLATKIRNTPPERIAPRESQAFVLLLSTLVLQRDFVDALPSSEYERPLNLVRTINLQQEIE